MDEQLEVSHIVAAADESEAGRDAIWAAIRIAGRVHARVTVLRVLPFESQGELASLEQLRRWVESDLPAGERLPPIAFAVAHGMPGIEIGRFAERAHADLLVLGRKRRSRTTRLLLGDTADAVARRSRIACLFVPIRIRCPEHLLVAVDGSERGMAVPRAAHHLAGLLGARLDLVTVEPTREDEPLALAAAMPTARSSRIQSEVRHSLGHDLEVRRGRVAEEILAAVDQHDPDVLVVGCRRGGPAGVIEAGSTARHVLHEAGCAVLTIPL